MRRVTELKENECIHCRTKEEYDAIIDLLDKAGKMWNRSKTAKKFNAWEKQDKGVCLFIDGDVIAYGPFALVKIHEYTIHPASDFLQQFQWGEYVEVSDNGKEWFTRKFVGMNPIQCDCPFISVDKYDSKSKWKFCRKPNTERARIEAQISELQEKLKQL